MPPPAPRRGTRSALDALDFKVVIYAPPSRSRRSACLRDEDAAARMARVREDATSRLVFLVANGLAYCVDLHVVGAWAVAWKCGGVGHPPPWRVVAVPFFAASGVAAATQWRFFARVANLRLRPPSPFTYGSLAAEGGGGPDDGGSGGAAATTTIREDALPLARRGVVGVAASLPALCLLLFAQCAALGGARASSLGARDRRLARSCGAILALETAALCACVALNGRSSSDRDGARRCPSGLAGVATHALLVAFLVMALRVLARGGAPVDGALAPLYGAELLLAAALLNVWRRQSAAVYRLDAAQRRSVAAYVLACALAAAGQRALSIGGGGGGGRRPLGCALAALAAACFGVPLRCAVLRHARQLASSRGHAPPVPLGRNAEGHWAPTGAKASFWFLLGTFERVRADPPGATARVAECAATCASAAYASAPAGAAALELKCCRAAGDRERPAPDEDARDRPRTSPRQTHDAATAGVV